jgi:hypothetical protein
MPLPLSLRSSILVCVLAGAATAQLTLTLSQPCGPGSARMAVAGASANGELYNLISVHPSVPTGSGPIFGLGLMGSDSLLAQILSPVGTHPFHVLADGSGAYDWQFCFPPLMTPLPVDCVTLEWGPNGYVAHSSVAHAIIDL